MLGLFHIGAGTRCEYSPASGREGEYTVHIDARSTLLEICGGQQPSNSNGAFC